jgi:glutamyl-tRNA synthetase
MTGLIWDEGPDKGGPFGPYIQSERKHLYWQYAQELIQKGHAYYCFCTKEEIQSIRKQAEEEEGEGTAPNAAPIIAYDGRCSRLSPKEVEHQLQAQSPFVIRQKINRQGATVFQDLVYGEITIQNEQLDDQVLLKSDGLPTYNFANVVDDHLMEISHVVRGSEYLSSAPKYLQLYDNLGWKKPQSIHLPHILGPNGKKLSKREGSVALSDFLAKGYLPEAILNYIALLGWSPGDDSEFFTLEDLVHRFQVKRINKSPAIFDEIKLKHINSLHIKAKAPEAFHELALKYYPEEIRVRFDTRKVSALIQTRLEQLIDIEKMTHFLIQFCFPYDLALYEHKKMKTTPASSLAVLKEVKGRFQSLSSWNAESLHQLMIDFAAEKGIKNGQVMWPVRVALTGLPVTPGGAVEAADLLGKDEVHVRLEKSVGLLESQLRE